MELMKKSGKYLGKSDFSEDGNWYTIKDVTDESVEDKDGNTENKYVLYFNEFEKGLILNEGNREAVVEATGTSTTDFMVGKKVNVYHDPDVSFGGKRTGGVRIRRKAFKA